MNDLTIATTEEARFLDCATFESAIESIAKATAREPADISARVHSFNRDAGFDPMLDPSVERPKSLIEWIDPCLSADRFDGAYYFHGSRVFDPESFFQRGIRTLPEMLDEIWTRLGQIALPDVSAGRWSGFRKWFQDESTHEFASMLRRKVGDPDQRGPFAEIVRPMFLAATHGRHDYLRTPEAVEDICHVANSHFGLDLLSRFQAVSVPCIVKFESEQFSDEQLRAVATFLIDHLDGESTEYVFGYIPDGLPIPPDRVVEVDRLPHWPALSVSG